MRKFYLLFGEKLGCSVHGGFTYYTQSSVLAIGGLYEKHPGHNAYRGPSTGIMLLVNLSPIILVLPTYT